MVTFARIKTSTCGTNDNQRSGKLTVDLCGEKGVWCGEKEFGVGKRSLVRRKRSLVWGKGVWCGEKEFDVAKRSLVRRKGVWFGKRSLVRRKCWFALKSLCCAFFINLKQLA